jgi:hypothetical protein
MKNPNGQTQMPKDWLKHFGPMMLMVASLIVLATTVPTALAAPTQNYTFTTVDAPGKDLANSYQQTYINDSGLVIQQYCDIDGHQHAAALLSSGWTIIDVPGADDTFPRYPNSRGQVPLVYWEPDGITRAAIWQRGQLTFIPDEMFAGYVYSGGLNINDRGQITASVFDSVGNGLAFVGDGKHHKVFGYPGSGFTFPLVTSNSGITVGAYLDSDGLFQAFSYDGTHFTTIVVPGAQQAQANDINSEGDIVGVDIDSSGNWAGFQLQRGHLTDFDVPQSLQTMLFQVTDNHKITGTYQAADLTWHGFVATPVEGN